MRFSSKIFLAIFISTLTVGSGILWISHHYVYNRTESSFLERYTTYTRVIGDTLVQLEKNTEALMYNAAKVVVLTDEQEGLLNRDELIRLSKILSVTHIFVIDSQGNFIRSTNEDPSLIPNLFSFCADYKKLILGISDVEGTPIIPPTPEPNPYKFLTLPTHDRLRLIEVGVKAEFIGKTLTEALFNDTNILELNLYTPNGVSLGRFGRSGNSFQRHKIAIPSDLRTIDKSNADFFVFYHKVKSSQTQCCQCDNAHLSIDGEYYYALKAEISKAELKASLTKLLYIFAILQLIMLLVGGIVARTISNKLVDIIKNLTKRIQNIVASKNLKERLGIKGNDEISNLAKNFDMLLLSLEESREKLIESEKKNEQIKIAAQVAHDIRSPLAALSMTIKDIHDKLPEVERISLRSSVKRIQDIANNLSQMKQKSLETQAQEKQSNTGRVELLSSLTENVISEKRTQYRDRQGITIDEHFDESSYGAFAALDSVEFKRLISNLINNAVEALEEKGTINVSLAATEHEITIAITDTGKGIPIDRLEKVFDRGVSFGKKDGRGLGLAHAKETMEKWNGTIRIESEVGSGTTVRLVLKRAESPAWFLPRIIVNPRTKIIILDDDQSIHDIWKSRFRHYDLADGEIEMLHFSSASAFSAWYTKQRFPYCRILSDYELLGETTTGLDVIEKYYEGERSILVTSHCEEEAIQKRCEKIGTKLLPKGLAYLVPIEVHLRDVYDAIFIGDNNKSQLHWKLSAQEHKKTVHCYSEPKEFINEASILDRNIPIYIEEGFAQGQSLHATLEYYGFKRVTVTNTDPMKSPPFPWTANVLDNGSTLLHDVQ